MKRGGSPSRLWRASRRLKRRFYRALTGAYRALLGDRSPAGVVPPVSPATLRRVLVIRHDAVGDMVVTTPALSYLRQVAPQAEIDVLASPRNAALVAGDWRVTHTFVNDRTWAGWLRATRAMRARRYDAVISPILGRHQWEGMFAAAVAPRGAARITAWRHPQFAGLFTHNVRIPRGRRHMAERLLYVVQSAVRDARAARPAGDVAEYPMWVAADARADARVANSLASHALGDVPFVALNAWAADRWRRLGVPLATALAAALARRYPGLAFALTPPPGREAEARAIAEGARACLGDAAARVVVAPPTPGLADLVALLRRAAVVVTPDTGNVHVASAAGRPVVAFYTARTTVVAQWMPLGVPSRVIELPRGAPLSQLAVEDAVAAFDALAAQLRLCGGAPETCDGASEAWGSSPIPLAAKRADDVD